jgi:opine dehydrogenase
MKVAILGAGAQAFALAVFLGREGHDPILWSPSGRGTAALAAGPVTATGVIEGTFRPAIADDCAAAVRDSEVVVVALPAAGHRLAFERMVPALTDQHMVVISSHASFGALYLDALLAGRGLELPIVAWSTTLLRSRKPDAASVRIATVRKGIDAAVLPANRTEEGIARCRAVFGDRFRPLADLLAVSLSNMNAQSHMALCLCNFTRMELAEQWDQATCTTEGVGRLAAALDSERTAIADAFGITVRSMGEHKQQTHGATAPVVPTMGPASTESRYVLEDVPFGLAVTVALARLAAVPTPLHEAGARIFSVLYGEDLAVRNDLLASLELDRIDVAEFRRRCREGAPRPARGG